MFLSRVFRRHPDAPDGLIPVVTPAGWGGVSADYEKPSGLSWSGIVLAWVGLIAGAVLLLLCVAQWAPGVPEAWRPFGRFRLWRAERFFAEGVAAERAGNWETARVAYVSALAARPDAPAPRWRMGRRLAEAGRFDEAMAMLASVTVDPSIFVHDALVSAEDSEGLTRFALSEMRRDPARRGMWICALRLALAQADAATMPALSAHIARAAESARGKEAGWLAAVRGEAEGRVAEMGAALHAIEADGGPDVAEVFLGLEMWVRAGLDRDAWIWVQRHKGRLGAFDAWFADWRVTLARDPGEAAGRLREISASAMDAPRWHRLAAVAWPARHTELFAAMERLAGEGAAPASSACVSMWALAMSRNDDASARKWEERVRRVSGPELPVLVGRALASADKAARQRASVLLAAQAGLPRELMLAVALDR